MKNVKDQVYAALCTVSDNVSDIYPTDWSKPFSVQYTEEANTVYSKTDDQEQLCYLRYRILLWGSGSLSQLACDVDTAMSALGLVRTTCQDADDPTHRRHKIMRYEGIMDVETEQVFWNQNR